jgi:hypothetical protein
MIAALDEIPRASEPCDPALDWRPVRDHLGITAFGVNAFLGAAPGDRVVELHDESSTREAFATAPDTAVLVVGATPGRPFAVSDWEARQLGRSGRA